jgi:large subunit ribosomal protein L17
MRHRKGGRKLGMDSSARKAMFRNMVTSLMLHGSIRTTEARAKELRRFADKVITIAKRAPSASAIEGLSGVDASTARAARVHAFRRARRWVNNDQAMSLVFGDYAARFAERPGGYTRVLKAGFRAGDNAPMAIIEVVGTSQRVDSSEE